MFSHTSYVHDKIASLMTPSLHLKCVDLHRNPKNTKITSFDENIEVSVALDVETQSIFKDGTAVGSTNDCTSSQNKHYAFETSMQRVNLTCNNGTKKVTSRDRKKLPGLLLEGGCKTTTLNPFAFTWDTPEISVLTKILTQDAKMLHYPLTTDQREKQFLSLSEFNDTGKKINIKHKVFPENYELCEKPKRLQRKT